jgi:hypothetical protein
MTLPILIWKTSIKLKSSTNVPSYTLERNLLEYLRTMIDGHLGTRLQ